ncbi:hypothetical protein ACFQJC_15230 [Haloferax namakaokahaiae]|uniref:DUF8080 domain-containing protein n=1 Tax=Haloferax namakaokahaiae TaxID=1748331 RepID=A0ABD5ZHZ2_9EURY
MDYTLDVSTTDGVTLVSVVLENTAPIDRRVRVEHRLDGPVFPPRHHGVPESGWDEDGFEGVVPAESTRSLGYSCPVAPDAADADADIVAVEVLGRAGDDSEMTPDDVVRELGPSRPPADVVSASPAVESSPDSADSEEPTAESTSLSERERTVVSDSDSEAYSETDEPTATDRDVADAVAKSDCPKVTESADSTHTNADLPDDLDAYFDALERRLELAERLEGVGVGDAATVLSEPAADPSSLSHLDADRETLRQIATRATQLADRAATVSSTTDALRRVA